MLTHTVIRYELSRFIKLSIKLCKQITDNRSLTSNCGGTCSLMFCSRKVTPASIPKTILPLSPLGPLAHMIIHPSVCHPMLMTWPSRLTHGCQSHSSLEAMRTSAPEHPLRNDPLTVIPLNGICYSPSAAGCHWAIARAEPPRIPKQGSDEKENGKEKEMQARCLAA